MFFSMLKINSDEDSENKNLVKRPSTYNSLINLRSDFYDSLLSFYDKKEEIIVAEKELPSLFNYSSFQNTILSKEDLLNWGDFGFYKRDTECPEFYNRYFSLFQVNYDDFKQGLIALAYSFISIKYMIENDSFKYISNKCSYQYLQILKGLVTNSISSEYKDYHYKNSKLSKENMHLTSDQADNTDNTKKSDISKNDNLIKDKKSINQDSTKIPKSKKISISNLNTNKAPIDLSNIKTNFQQIHHDLLLSKFINEEFIMVLYKNTYWRIVITPNPKELASQIEYIVNTNINTFNQEFIGILTYSSDFTTKYGVEFVKLSQNNLKLITKLENCLLLVKIEQFKTSDYLKKSDLLQECWFGNKAYFNKVCNFTIFADGYISINLEKTIDREIPKEISRYTALIYKYVNYIILNKPISQLEFDSNFIIVMNSFFKDLNNKFESKLVKTIPRQMKFEINHYFKELIFDIVEEQKSNSQKINLVISQQKNYFSKMVLGSYLDLEFYIQIAVNAALYRYTRDLQVVVSEVSTRDFLHGGSELMRINTKNSNAYALAMSLEYIPRELKVKLGYDSIKELKKYKKLTKEGYSVDTRMRAILNSLSINSTINTNTSINNKDNKTNTSPNNITEDNQVKNIDFYNRIKNKIKLQNNNINSQKAFNNNVLKVISNNKMFKFFNRKFATSNYHGNKEDTRLTVSPPFDVRGIGITTIVNKDYIEFIFCSYNFEKYFLKRLSECLEEILIEMKDLYIQKSRKTKF